MRVITISVDRLMSPKSIELLAEKMENKRVNMQKLEAKTIAHITKALNNI